jgi:hypothetical protein
VPCSDYESLKVTGARQIIVALQFDDGLHMITDQVVERATLGAPNEPVHFTIDVNGVPLGTHAATLHLINSSQAAEYNARGMGAPLLTSSGTILFTVHP